MIRHFVPLRGVVRFEIEADKIDGRKIAMKGKFSNNIYSIKPLDENSKQKEIIHTEATALFIQVKNISIAYDQAVELFGPNSKLSKKEVIQLFKEFSRKRKETPDEFLPSKL